VRANRESKDFSPGLSGLRANIFLDLAETLIMKFRFLPLTFLLLFILTIVAGCSSSTSSPGTSPASSDPKPWEVGTPVPYTDLSQLFLSRSEMPFIPVDQKVQTRNMTDPVFSRFGAIRGITRYTINEQDDSPTSIQLGQTIVEYPPGNATKAYAAFVAENQKSDTLYNITATGELGIGQRSSAMLISDRSGTQKPITMLVFVKSNIMETIILDAPSWDLTTLTRVAKFAAAKIP